MNYGRSSMTRALIPVLAIYTFMASGINNIGKIITEDKVKNRNFKTKPSMAERSSYGSRFSRMISAGWHPYRRERVQGRNEQCNCGSGLKFKICCIR